MIPVTLTVNTAIIGTTPQSLNLGGVVGGFSQFDGLCLLRPAWAAISPVGGGIHPHTQRRQLAMDTSGVCDRRGFFTNAATLAVSVDATVLTGGSMTPR